MSRKPDGGPDEVGPDSRDHKTHAAADNAEPASSSAPIGSSAEAAELDPADTRSQRPSSEAGYGTLLWTVDLKPSEAVINDEIKRVRGLHPPTTTSVHPVSLRLLQSLKT